MKKQTFIQGTIILVIVGMVVKVFGLINRMMIARLLTSEGIGIYMMVMPTFTLLIALAQLGFPIAISKLVSENNIKKQLSNKTIVMKAFKISLINSSILMILLLLSAKFLSFNLLNDKRTYYPILMLVFFIPLVSFSSIIKGYLHGYKIISVPSYSQLYEQVIRIVTSITLVTILIPYSIELAVCGAIISLSIGEAVSLIYMIYKIKNKRSWNQILNKQTEKTTDEKTITKSILAISIPATGSRLIGSVSHFFEPIIFSFAMISIGISSGTVTKIYGQITGYTLSLLLVPSFFCIAVSIPLIPIISEAYANRNYNKISHYFNLSIFLSFLSGCIFTIILTLFPKELMQLFFNTNEGVIFLSYMAPMFLVYYFQLPITTTLHVVNKTKSAMINTLIGAVLKVFLIYILVSNPNIHVHGLTTAIIFNSIFVTIANFWVLRKTIKMHYNIYTILTSISLLITTFFFGNILKNTSIISSSFLNILVIFMFYVIIVYLSNIGDIRKIKSQLFNH